MRFGLNDAPPPQPPRLVITHSPFVPAPERNPCRTPRPTTARRSGLLARVGWLALVALRTAGPGSEMMAGEPTNIVLQSPARRVTLLELYTSEGCSSCPPAETWLTRMERSPKLWQEFVPVAFHVDYWDNTAWRDAWSQPAFSERQRQYAVHGHSENVYTPGFLVNGREWRGWFQGRATLPVDPRAAGTLTLRSNDTNQWRAVFLPTAPMRSAPWLHAALLEGGLNSEVRGGENHGRHLRHDFAVVDFRDVRLAAVGSEWQATFPLTSPKSARPAGTTRAVAAWVTADETSDPLQAVGGWLVPPPASTNSAPPSARTSAPPTSDRVAP